MTINTVRRVGRVFCVGGVVYTRSYQTFSARVTKFGSFPTARSPGSSRLYRLGVSQAQKSRSRGISPGGNALHSVRAQLLLISINLSTPSFFLGLRGKLAQLCTSDVSVEYVRNVCMDFFVLQITNLVVCSSE